MKRLFSLLLCALLICNFVLPVYAETDSTVEAVTDLATSMSDVPNEEQKDVSGETEAVVTEPDMTETNPVQVESKDNLVATTQEISGKAKQTSHDKGTDLGYVGSFNVNGLITLYDDINGNAFNSVTNSLPDSFTVEKKFIDSEDTVWYLLGSPEWPEEYAAYVYVLSEIVNIEVPDQQTEKKESIGGVEVNVSGNIPEDVSLNLEEAEVDHEAFGVEDAENIVAALDISLVDSDGADWQPEESVTVTLDAASLGLSDGDVVEILHEHEGVISSLGEYTVTDGLLTFSTDAFSIYVVTTNDYSNDWNYNNYEIMMSVGDTLDVAAVYNGTQENGNNYKWTLIEGDTSAFTLSNDSSSTAKIHATAVGSATLQCTYTSGRNNNRQYSIIVTSVPANGDISNDIIFENITAEYTDDSATSITEYGNTYGPYVMKIRFEDTYGNLLVMGQPYYVYDSACPININTFAADAPAGYTYDGAYFYWTGHYSGTKSYVSEVTRLSTLGYYNSYLYFDYIVAGETSVNEDTHYQPSGVLHIVYRKSDEAYNVRFVDHDGTTLHSYAPAKADIGYATIPAAYVATLDTTLNTVLNEHHGALSEEWIFTDSWKVTGGGVGIDGTYTTAQLKTLIPSWRIKTDITITAQCEQKVTINYVAVGPENAENFGFVNPTSETILATGTASGSIASAGDGYQFVGWYENVQCTGDPLSTNEQFVPAKGGDGQNVAATYYAKFEEKTVTITYVAVGPTGESNFGTVAPGSETVAVITGTASGSVPTPGENFRFVGWFTDQECTVAVTQSDGSVAEDGQFTPNKPNSGKWETVTYYALFEYNKTSLRITKAGAQPIDENQTFLFQVSGEGKTFTVPVVGNGTVVINDVTVGATYTITEIAGWSWRYSSNTAEVTIIPNPESMDEINHVTIQNSRTNNNWLNGTSYATNVFKK